MMKKIYVLIFLFLAYAIFLYPVYSTEEESYEILIEKLKSGSVSEKQDAVFKLGNMGNKDCVPLLIVYLDDEDLKMEALTALGKINDKSAVMPIAALLQDKNPIVRGIAAETLTSLDDPNALDSLKIAYKGETEEFARKR